MLPGRRLPRVAVMKLQNSAISTTRLTARRTASAFVWTPSAFRARLIALSSTKKDLRVYRAALTDVFLTGISYSLVRHISRQV